MAKLIPFSLAALTIASSIAISYSQSTPKDTPKQPAPNVPQQSIDDWIKQLGAQEYLKRKAASDYLWHHGGGAMEKLEAASRSNDPEIALRARRIYQNISAGILPSTPKEIAALVKRFRSATSIEAKLLAFNDLEKASAFKQMVYLYSWEKNPTHKAALYAKAEAAALPAARIAISKQQLLEAETLLKLLPRDGKAGIGLATLLQHNGQLEQEIQRLKNANQDNSLWYAHLLTVKGDVKALHQWALEQDHQETLTKTSLLTKGDPSLLIAHLEKRQGDVHANEAFHIAQLIQQGQFKEAEQRAQNYVVRHKNDEQRHLVTNFMASLLVNGYASEAETPIRKLLDIWDFRLFHTYFFNYYGDGARPYEFMKHLRLTMDKEQVKRWANAHIVDAEKEDPFNPFSDADSFHLKRLILAAQFYNDRGDKDTVRNVLRPLFTRLHELEHDLWFSTASEAANKGIGWFVIEEIKRLKNDSRSIDKTIEHIASKNEQLLTFWGTYKGDDDATIAHLEKFLSFIGVTYTNDENIAEMAKLLDAKIALSAKDAAKKLLEAKAHAARYRNDIPTALAAMEKLRDKKLGSYWEDEYYTTIKGINDWDKLVAFYVLHENEYKFDPTHQYFYSIALRRSGRADKAEKQLRYAKLLMLNDSDALYQAGLEHYYASNEGALAAANWEKAILCTKVDSSALSSAIHGLSSYVTHLADTQQWRKAAAIAAADKFLHIKPFTTHARTSFGNYYPSTLRRLSTMADFTAGMALLQSDKAKGIAALQRCYEKSPNGSDLSEVFFPSIRAAGLKAQHDQWFNTSFTKLNKVITDFPNSHNVQNATAWLCARANRKLPEAETLIKRALKLNPNQSAYIDTHAEIWFARKDRAKAVAISKVAVEAALQGNPRNVRRFSSAMYNYQSLITQLKRFEQGSFPVK